MGRPEGKRPLGRPEVQRPLGRPRSVFEDNIKTNLQKLG